MRAAVDQHGDAPVLIARHDDGLRADRARDEIPRMRDLAVVADEDPSAIEDPLHLVLDDARVRVERGVDSVVADERLVIEWREGHRSIHPNRASC
jgi:hypothetical protein